MQIRFASTIAVLAGASLLAACSGDNGILGSSLTTSSVSSTPVTQPVTPRQDPACAALATRIDQLRADGVTERVEKASAGKGTTVQVKRTSLAQMAELDKANAEFTTKCTPIGVRPQQVFAAPAMTAPATTGSTTTAASTPPTNPANVITAKAATPVAPPIVPQTKQ